MLHSSFTIRPANDSGEAGAKDGGVEVTLREAREAIVAKPTMIHTQNSNIHHHDHRRVRADSASRVKADPFAGIADPFPFYNPCPQPQKRQKRAFSEYVQHQPRQQLPPPPSSQQLHRIPVEETSHPPRIRRIPFEFEPPSREEYWKQRCWRMQNLYYGSRSQIRDMKEDQRQMLRRIHELEKHILLQSSNSKSAEKEENDANSLTMDDSREYEEEDPRQNAEPEQRVRSHTNSAREEKTSSKSRGGLPAFLSIPKCMPAAACFYLTDGEGLSDSELLDEKDDGYYYE